MLQQRTDQPGILISMTSPGNRRDTHKYQGRVQIFIVFREEIPVVLVSHLAIACIESSLMILNERYVLFLAERRSQRKYGQA